MRKLIELLTFAETRDDRVRPPRDDQRLSDERDAALQPDKAPLVAADIETLSEYRLASLLQFPHH